MLNLKKFEELELLSAHFRHGRADERPSALASAGERAACVMGRSRRSEEYMSGEEYFWIKHLNGTKRPLWGTVEVSLYTKPLVEELGSLNGLEGGVSNY